MAASKRLADVVGTLRGLGKVANSFGETQAKNINLFWQHSSLNTITPKIGEQLEQTISSAVVKQAEIQVRITALARMLERISLYCFVKLFLSLGQN